MDTLYNIRELILTYNVRELTPKLTLIFRNLVKKGSFSACWKLDDVVPVPKRSSSSDVGDYKPILLLPSYHRYLKRSWLESYRHFLKCNCLLPPFQFLYQRCLGTCDYLLILSHHLQVALTLYVTGCAKSHDKIKYYIITFKIELRRNFPCTYSFFIPHSIRLFYKIRNSFEFVKTVVKNWNIYT